MAEPEPAEGMWRQTATAKPTPDGIARGRSLVASRLREAARLKGRRLGEGRTWVEEYDQAKPPKVVYVHAEAPVLCSCPVGCTVPAAERCGACIGGSCVHLGPVGTPPGTPLPPVGTHGGVTLSHRAKP